MPALFPFFFKKSHPHRHASRLQQQQRERADASKKRLRARLVGFSLNSKSDTQPARVCAFP